MVASILIYDSIIQNFMNIVVTKNIILQIFFFLTKCILLLIFQNIYIFGYRNICFLNSLIGIARCGNISICYPNSKMNVPI